MILISASCKKADVPDSNQGNTDIAGTAARNSKNALPYTKQYPADVATAWYTLLTQMARTKPYANPQALRIYAYSGVALYEAVVPGMPSYQSIFTYITGNRLEVDHKKDYYWPACANSAMARIATRIMQNYPTPNLTQVQALETSLNTSYQLQTTSEQLQFSNDFGRYVADIIYDWSKTDGTLNPDGTLAVCPPYIPVGGPGNWVATPPFFIPAAGACQGSLRTFIPNIANTLFPPAHPSYSTDPSSPFFQSANEIYQRSLQLSTDDIRLVTSWRDFAGNYNQPSRTLKLVTDIFSNDDINLEDASVLYARINMGMFDAIVASSKAKFHYSLLRPITYIRNTMGYASWNPTIPTPPLPSYVGFQGLQASSVRILEKYYGTNYPIIDSTQKTLYGSWSYSSLDGWLQDLSKSALNSGTEFRFGVETGIAQGEAVGEMINALPFKKQ
jgi:hypothetical protein